MFNRDNRPGLARNYKLNIQHHVNLIYTFELQALLKSFEWSGGRVNAVSLNRQNSLPSVFRE
jgi:hypothetical protein